MTDTFRPGDIWRHTRMGNLAVTGEPGCKPGYLKCYWMMGGNPNAPWTCMDLKRTEHFTLIFRMDEGPIARSTTDPGPTTPKPAIIPKGQRRRAVPDQAAGASQ